MIAPEEFKEDVITLAKDVGVDPKEIHIRKMKRKWASCSSKGRLTFDITLLSEPKEVRFKAILHELLHLRYPGHGRMFKTLLNTYLENNLTPYNNDGDNKDHQTPNGNGD